MGLIGKMPLKWLRAGGRAWHLARRLTGEAHTLRCLILTYHDIADGAAAELFERQMKHLSCMATVVPLRNLLQIARRGGGRGIYCAITFDDGYEGVYRNAFARLLEHRFAATVYLSSGFVRESGAAGARAADAGLIDGHPLLSWRQAREMTRAGICFGSHMSEHGDLSVLGEREAKDQLRRSREEISCRLGRRCDHFAYPFGRFSAAAVKWVREAGFESAATTVHRALTARDDPWRLPRAGIAERYSMRDFERIIAGDWDFIGLLQTLRRPLVRARPRSTSP